ncbi:MAG: hypothetical protein ACLR6B_07085 [Blautia sp.]
MNENESQWDKLLKIKTTGRDDSHADQYRYPYEPTPYSVLERLANSGLIGKTTPSWTMAPAKAESAFFYPTRHAAVPLVWNTMNGSFPGQKKTDSMPFPGTGLPLKCRQPKPIPYQ